MEKRLTPARIALLYAAFAGLWIFASDKILALAVPDSALIIKISLFKGFVFVLITTWLLYQLMQTMVTTTVLSGNASVQTAGIFKIRSLRAIFLGLVMVVPLFGYGIAKIYGPHIQKEAFEDLTAIAELKAAQVETWLQERSNDANELAENGGFTDRYEQWLKYGNAKAKSLLLSRLNVIARTHGYEPALLRADGRRAMTSGTAPDPVSEREWQKLLKSAFSSGKVQHSDLYRDSNNKSRLDYVIPLRLSNPQRMVGAVVLRAPVESFLFPLIQSWPTASPSAETVLIRREGNQILHLNELRHRKGSAMTLRMPMSRHELISVSAMRNNKPMTLEGRDYRDVRVLAATRPIRGTDWHLIAKVDQNEVMALLHEMLFWVSLVAIIAVTVVASAVLMLWRQQQRMHQMELDVRTLEQDRQLKLFYDLPFIGMAISSPVSKTWQYVNDHLCDMLGYSRDELLNTTWADITHSDNLDDYFTQFDRMKAGEIDGYSMEKRFLRKDGSPISVNLNVKCTRGSDGKVDHIVAMIEDITERKQAEALLRRTEQDLLAAQEIGRFGSYDYDIVNDRWTSSAVMDRIFGIDASFTRNAAGWGELVHPSQREEMLAYLGNIVERHLPFDKEYRIINHSDSKERWVQGLGKVTYSPDGVALRMTGTIQDITERKRSEAALRESEDRFRSIFTSAIDGILLANTDTGKFVMSNPAIERMLGYSSEEILGIGVTDIHPAEALPQVKAVFDRQMRGEISLAADLPIKRKDGTVFFADINSAPITIAGKPCLMGTFRDVTERKKDEDKLRQSATVFESSHNGVTITDLDGNIIAVNAAFQKITGYSEAEVLGKNPRVLHSGRQSKDFYQSMWANILQAGYWHGEIWNRRKNGEIYPEWLTISAVKDAEGKTTHYVGTFSDLSQIKQSEEKAEHLAHYDPLTDLPNRLLVLSHLNHVLARAHRHQRHVGVLYLDLDRFKNVNDSLGYPVGDELLVKLTERLTMHMRSEDILARLGGDEFLLVLESVLTPEDAATVARTLLDLLAQPFTLSGEQEIFIGASIGISVFPNDGNSADQLIQYADAAMHQAKEQGRNNYLFYTDSLTRTSGEHLELETRLRHAIAADQLRVYYQPQVDIATGHIIGAEALVRWQDPERGLITPADFILLAEETGLIGNIGEWVLKEACLQGRRWIESGQPFMTVAINLSPHQFKRSNIVDVVSRILAETGFPADRLELELTESALMQQEEKAVTMLHLLRAQGIRLAIDDFGTGYSSLAYLKRFPLDVLKIDKSFVDDIPFHQDDMEIASTIIAMGHSLGFKVLAEGVETPEQLNFLQKKGCDMYQGYLTSPPVPPEEFEKMLQKSSPAASHVKTGKTARHRN